jgi:hypothetical protein
LTKSCAERALSASASWRKNENGWPSPAILSERAHGYEKASDFLTTNSKRFGGLVPNSRLVVPSKKFGSYFKIEDPGRGRLPEADHAGFATRSHWVPGTAIFLELSHASAA